MLVTHAPRPFALIALIALMGFVGCESQQSDIDNALDDSTAQFERARLLLTDEPADALTPTDAKEKIAESSTVVLAGRIHAGDIEPFMPGVASFMMTQLPDEGHGADDPDHADNCPFCKRRLKSAPKVIAEFKDNDGKLIDIDSKELFGIEKGDAVVITGEAEYQETTNTLKVDAKGLFKRKS